VRYEDDISNSPFFDPSAARFGIDDSYYSWSVPIPENRQKHFTWRSDGRFRQPTVGGICQRPAGNIHRMRRVELMNRQTGVSRMLGKLAGAWLGEKVAGPNKGAKGAILGYGAAAIARRSVPALAAVALGGWAFRKWRDKRRANPSYPSEASPSSD
jgi:hypothetical protein